MQENEFIDLYKKSIKELEKLIKLTKTRPSEKVWNKHAIENGFLLSQTISYMSDKSFNLLCRELIKKK